MPSHKKKHVADSAVHLPTAQLPEVFLQIKITELLIMSFDLAIKAQTLQFNKQSWKSSFEGQKGKDLIALANPEPPF